jgi:hypothetical protein
MSAMTEHACLGCGEPLPLLARPNRRYHDGRCRAVAHRRREHVHSGSGVPVAGILIAEHAAVLDAATSEVRLVALVAQAAARPGGWRAAAWLLERRHPERWGQPGRVERNEPPPAPPYDDPFREVDELAERRRRRPTGYS